MSKLVFFLFVLISAKVLCETLPVPILFWAENLRFKDKHVLVPETIDSSDAQSVLESFIGEESGAAKLRGFVENAPTPRAIVVFVEPQLRTDIFSELSDAHGSGTGGSFANLKGLVENSESSLVIPYMTLDRSFSSALREILQLNKKVQVKVVLPAAQFETHSLRTSFADSATFLVQEALLNEISGTTFTDKETKVYVVGFPEGNSLAAVAKQHDEVIGQISQALKTKTQGNFVGIFTAERPSEQEWKLKSAPVDNANVEEFLYMRYAEAIEQNPTTTVPPTTKVPSNQTMYDNHWPPEVWEGLMVAAVLLIILYIGMCCTYAIQVPRAFVIDHKKRD
eukprot:TRINITY_DN3975_c0_g1_i4.p1 TRINITY_DN3975_c0_g1~~TRINITY_DN3975_c0_g1_i4.p1  ORF type:complete len:367 (-),score=110.04 TRINITY_DN3975_c0_g1_i4:485-1498(-)